MPAVFVHGVPDTHHVWDRVLAHLTRDDVVCLSLPGFGCPRPDGFTATKEAYLDWLIGALEALDGPIDLVAHDWGCLRAARALSVRPDLVRSWAIGSGIPAAGAEWHGMARKWQTPVLGELVMLFAARGVLKRSLIKDGVPPEMAAVEARAWDCTMKRCVLDLYRSAVDVGDEWAPGMEHITPPGLVFWGKNDPYTPVSRGQQFAERTGVGFVPLETGHWWPCEAPQEVAAALAELWAEVE